MNRAHLVLASSLFVALPTFAQPNVTVTVLPDRYVMGGRTFDDLDRLGAEVRALRPGSIILPTCVPGAARTYKAAVHRFRDLPLQSVVLRGESVACSPATLTPAAFVSHDAALPRGIDDAAVDAYWVQLSP